MLLRIWLLLYLKYCGLVGTVWDGDGVMRVTGMVGMGIEACRGGWGWIQSLWGWMRTGTKVCPCAGLYCD